MGVRRVAELARLRAPQPAPPLEAVRPLRERGRVGRGFRAADGRRRGPFRVADFVRRQAIEAIDLLIDFPLQSYGVGRGLKPTGWRTLYALPGSNRGNLLRWPCRLLIVPYEKWYDVCPVLPDMIQGESYFG